MDVVASDEILIQDEIVLPQRKDDLSILQSPPNQTQDSNQQFVISKLELKDANFRD